MFGDAGLLQLAMVAGHRTQTITYLIELSNMVDFGMAKLTGKLKYTAIQELIMLVSVLILPVVRKEKRAPCSGTRGYRAPEVLLQYQRQTSD